MKLKIKLLLNIKLTWENFTARLKQANLASKNNIANFVKRIDLNKNELNGLLKKVKVISTKRLTKDFINKFNILNGAKCFTLGVFQNYLVFIPTKKYIKYFSSTSRIDLWKSNGMSEEKIENITKSDSYFSPTFVDHHVLPDINFNDTVWQPSRGPPCKYHAISITGKPMPIPEQRRHPRHSNNTSKFREPSGPAILQLNVEGLTRPKCEVIQKIADDNSISAILLQETHASSSEKIKIYGYSLIDSIHHPKHGIATLVRNDLLASIIDRSREGSETEWITISINGEISITNIYKPPNAPFDPPPRYEHPAIYSGDFNCHHTFWGYSRNDPAGAALYDWSSTIDLKLLYDPNQPKSFHSAAWNTFTNPDLTFYTHDISSSLPHPVHNVTGNFPKSQHRPTIIYHPALIEYTPTTPLPRWNFNKADWERFQAATRNICDDLPLPESDINLCFSEFQKRISKIANNTIPRGFRKNYIPKWDTTCDELAS